MHGFRNCLRNSSRFILDETHRSIGERGEFESLLRELIGGKRGGGASSEAASTIRASSIRLLEVRKWPLARTRIEQASIEPLRNERATLDPSGASFQGNFVALEKISGLYLKSICIIDRQNVSFCFYFFFQQGFHVGYIRLSLCIIGITIRFKDAARAGNVLIMCGQAVITQGWLNVKRRMFMQMRMILYVKKKRGGRGKGRKKEEEKREIGE